MHNPRNPEARVKRSQKSINNRGRMGVLGGHLTDVKNTANNRSGSCLIWKSNEKHDRENPESTIKTGT